MDRYWLITWTCYGHWLPGDRRGFVGNIRDDEGKHVVHNIPGTPCDQDVPKLEKRIKEQMSDDPVELGKQDADALISQYQETARIRGWSLEAASVMFNHTHLVTGVEGDPDPSAILSSYKSWATRVLKNSRKLPKNGSFWTAKGSKRKLSDEKALHDAVIYVVKKQPNPLTVFWREEWSELLEDSRRAVSRKRPGE